MEWKDILWELVQMVQEAAPKAWEIALAQVDVMIYKMRVIGTLMTTLASVMSLGIVMLALRRVFWARYKDDDGWMMLLFLVFTVPFIFWGVSLLVDANGFVMNPEYYAIQALVSLVGTVY